MRDFSPALRRFVRALPVFIPKSRILQDDLSRAAFAGDASFYRLVPRVIVKIENEEEASKLLELAGRERVPVTFRGAGTSLSGQAVSDSVLAVVSRSWNKIEVAEDRASVSAGPAAIGGDINRRLEPFSLKIGPDPASIHSATIGGIAANNASGMCCGTAHNSYQTLVSLRAVFADGSVVDTGSSVSRAAFLKTHPAFIEKIEELRGRIRKDETLVRKIRQKYRIKNTMGYGLNAFVDFEDPVDILSRLLIGSEGTLAFMSEITLRTIPENGERAVTLAVFSGLKGAACAVAALPREIVSAAELMDRSSLRAVEGKPGIPSWLGGLSAGSCAVLVETDASDENGLLSKISRLTQLLAGFAARPVSFTREREEREALWKIRKGLFTSVGAAREPGTTVIIEDVAFPLERLDEAALDLEALFKRHGYRDAILFGHALEGNLHFVFKQDFNREEETARYASFMEDLAELVVRRYDGSLKAEHGTGRNMAPFLEFEWGKAAYGFMKEIKNLFDPSGILNPGVLIDDDPRAHLKNLKPSPETDALIDRCTECGFCERVCPSRNFTLTPRQRIAVAREIVRLESAGEARDARRLRRGFVYAGEETCAADGICSLSCPAGIDTGEWIKKIRSGKRSGVSASGLAAAHFSKVLAAARFFLSTGRAAADVIGDRNMEALVRMLRNVSGGRIPHWNRFVPGGARKIRPPETNGGERFVYFPSCVSRTFASDTGVSVMSLARKAGYSAVFPAEADNLCCGLFFESKGHFREADGKREELAAALRAASAGGVPVLFDSSPCALRMSGIPGITLFEPARFIFKYWMERLEFIPSKETVVFHPTCSSQKLGSAAEQIALARLCSDRVLESGVACCGFAGDKGFTHPDLTKAALAELAGTVPRGVRAGISSSRTCEIGLSSACGIPFAGLLELADRHSRPKPPGTHIEALQVKEGLL